MAAMTLIDHAPLLGLLLLAAVIDARTRRLPNWLTLGLILSGLARAACLGGVAGLGHGFAGLFAGALAPLILFIMGALGGGDVKLFAGVGAWLGPLPVLTVFAVQCVIGLVLILAQSLTQRRTLTLFRNSALLYATISHRGLGGAGPSAGAEFTSIDRPMPYAVPVALATLAVLLAPSWYVF
ncbi:MAG: A24 family peptidase [Tepidisphaeraceae bacterium]|jgi:prepilin peptidase CpaA